MKKGVIYDVGLFFVALLIYLKLFSDVVAIQDTVLSTGYMVLMAVCIVFWIGFGFYISKRSMRLLIWFTTIHLSLGLYCEWLWISVRTEFLLENQQWLTLMSYLGIGHIFVAINPFVRKIVERRKGIKSSYN